MAALLRRSRLEVFPVEGIARRVASALPREIKVSVTSSPVRGVRATVRVVEALARTGFEAVPHLAARGIADPQELAELLDRLRSAGVDDLFVVAGDQREAAGPFQGALELLREIDRRGYEFRELGIAGYPEGHPYLSQEEDARAYREKRAFATYVVSQLCFDAGALVRWIQDLEERDPGLRLHVGVPGAVARRRLFRFARRIGVGESARFLGSHLGWLRRSLVPGAFRADRLLRRTVPAAADPSSGVVGLHVYTFNEVERTGAWRRRRLERLGGGGAGPGDGEDGGAPDP